ncbi:MAG: Smr/MutS family protein [Xanthobacteraceae bacterium]|nr:Smr/MutS family protein [Xanthobacteraceae bacterium]
MKRPPPPETMPSPRRKRALSSEERVLWESVAKSIKPLHKKPRADKAEPLEDEPPAASAKSEKRSSRPPALSQELKTPAVKATAPPPLAPIGRRERSQISRGRKDIDARLDLHGMTQTRAHRALLNFLRTSSEDGMTFVLVITGKGRTVGPDSERGVLRRQVPEWLSLPEFRSLIVGFEQAHIGHGGDGALYVRVRRAR